MAQDEVEAQAAKVFGHKPDYFRRMAAAYGNAGVDTRHSCVPLDWYLSSHGWPERMQLYEENAIALLTEASRACFAQAGISAQDIAATVTVSSTGVVTPSLDSLIQGPLGLGPHVARLPVFGLGCAGGVIGLSRAAALAQACPGQWVLFLCVELCGLTFRSGDDSKANLIGTAIFGDGAAALLLRTPCRDGHPVAEVRGAGEHTWPDTRDIMGWRVEDDGLGVVFSRNIPHLVRTKLRAVTDTFLEGHSLTLEQLAGVLCHPGGDKVLAALEGALDLDSDALRHARDVLRTKGNMSAVTVLAVLERAVANGDTGLHLMTALGPGFTAGMALVDLV
jgi:alkylresorcinol/alkylpyrone synthase